MQRRYRHLNLSYVCLGKIGFYEGDGKWFTPKRDLESEALLLAQIELYRYRLHENYAKRGNNPFKTIEEFVSYGNINDYTRYL